MFKAEWGTFINKYGYEEKYISKSVESRMSGHLCRGSAIETDSDCGNCDGARCDFCHELFTVRYYGEPITVTTDCGYEEQRENIINSRVFRDKHEAMLAYHFGL